MRIAAPAASLAPEASAPSHCLLNIAPVRYQPLVLSSGLDWHTIFAGPIVRGASHLLGGTPGAFKSGLALQIALDLARQGTPTLLILTEEPPHRAKERALRMTAQWPRANGYRFAGSQAVHVAEQFKFPRAKRDITRIACD